jgi:hypothetical protein
MLIEECDFDILETRRIDSVHKAFHVASKSSKVQACESREKNAFSGRWGDGECGGREMEWEGLKLAHLGQGFHESSGWQTPRGVRDLEKVKLNIDKTPGRRNALQECGKDDPS